MRIFFKAPLTSKWSIKECDYIKFYRKQNAHMLSVLQWCKCGILLSSYNLWFHVTSVNSCMKPSIVIASQPSRNFLILLASKVEFSNTVAENMPWHTCLAMIVNYTYRLMHIYTCMFVCMYLYTYTHIYLHICI